MTIKFEAGRTYQTRSICDYNCKITVTVVSRTAKTIRTEKGKTFRLSIWDGAETFRPWGNHSMCPIMSAEDGV